MVKFNPENDLENLQGRVAIVTGGNAGLGFATIVSLVRKGAKVYMAARSESKATAAIQQINDLKLPGSVHWLKLELSDSRNAQASARDFLEKEKRLDILVNNAGIMWGSYRRSVDDVLDMTMINYISPFVFTMTLLPLLKETAKEPKADVRIVMVSSGAHALVGETVQFKSVADFSHEYSNKWLPWFSRYGVTKLQDLLFAKELQRRLTESGDDRIIVTSVFPGPVYTFGYMLPLIVRILLWPFIHWYFQTPERGAYTQVMCAAGTALKEEPGKYKGKYLIDCEIKETHVQAEDEGLGKDLWNITEDFLSTIGITFE